MFAGRCALAGVETKLAHVQTAATVAMNPRMPNLNVPPMPSHFRATSLLLLCLLPLSAQAQRTRSGLACVQGAVVTALPGGIRDEEVRAGGIRASVRWSLLRGAADDAKSRIRGDTASEMPVRLAAVMPEVLFTNQSAFPLPGNDGPMWAGRGRSYSITGGLALCGKRGRWGAIIAPTFWYAENADFVVPDDSRFVPPYINGYSPWANRYYYMPRSLDAPRRFGPTAMRRTDVGILSVFGHGRGLEYGFTTEPQWWGPGQYNALLLSTQSAGIPRAYIRSVKPFRLAGELDFQYFIGGMSYSPFFFRQNPVDTTRSLAGLSLVWRPKFEPNLSLGAARVVMAPMAGRVYLKHVFDPILNVGAPNGRAGREDSTQFPGKDQLISVFANWRLPDDGAEVWAELARAELPQSFRDFFESPNRSLAMTIGAQKVQSAWEGWTWRLGAEYTQTNQSSTYRERPMGWWYTSRAVQAGFSQKGQVIGAMIGAGSVTQRLNVDFSGPSRSFGAFLYRIKWDDDSYLTIPRPEGGGFCKHDVSLAAGIRGSAVTRVGAFEGTLTNQNRLNLYWQALGNCFENAQLQVDKRNLSLEFRFRPRAR